MIMVTDATIVIKCKIYDTYIKEEQAKCYGVACDDDLNNEDVIDELSALLWANNSGCKLNKDIICHIDKAGVKVKYHTCNPSDICVTEELNTCDISSLVLDPLDPIACLLPISNINILK